MRDAVQRAFANVLLCTGLTVATSWVASRAVRLPLRRRARLRLVHVVPELTHRVDPRRVTSAARAALVEEQARVERLAREAGRDDLLVESTLLVGSAPDEVSELAGRLAPDLLVVGRRERRRSRDVLLGSTATRIVRRARAPVLVVSRPARGPYGRVAVALDLDRHSTQTAALAARLAKRPKAGPPLVRAIHAYEAPSRGAST
jgi:nucleotide-binding universal stress UspA family protein